MVAQTSARTLAHPALLQGGVGAGHAGSRRVANPADNHPAFGALTIIHGDTFVVRMMEGDTLLCGRFRRHDIALSHRLIRRDR